MEAYRSFKGLTGLRGQASCSLLGFGSEGRAGSCPYSGTVTAAAPATFARGEALKLRGSRFEGFMVHRKLLNRVKPRSIPKAPKASTSGTLKRRSVSMPGMPRLLKETQREITGRRVLGVQCVWK